MSGSSDDALERSDQGLQLGSKVGNERFHRRRPLLGREGEAAAQLELCVELVD